MAYDFPASPVMDQAFITNNRIYIWNGYAWISAGSVGYSEDVFVKKAGDTMTGTLTLHSDPADPLVAATKQYVDRRVEEIIPLGGTPGQAFVKNPANVPTWGAPIDGGEV
jgi:hypothetical protein